jgi:hypothetical protein
MYPRHVTLLLADALSDTPVAVINGLRGAVTLDEVQRTPDVFLPIKTAVDRD